MKFLICPDSFKGTMTAHEAAIAIRDGILEAVPNAETVLLPVGDGGEGTVAALFSSLKNAEELICDTLDPIGRPICASYMAVHDKTVFIESAAASGLTLLSTKERDIMNSDTFGTGILIADAYRRGFRVFYIAMGGTATCDGGAGAFSAIKKLCPELLGNKESRFYLLCDVDNPMCGKNGAAYIFAPQKGGQPEELPILDLRLKLLANSYKTIRGLDVKDMKYAGAAGGLSGMLMACFGATPLSGIDTVLDIIGFDRHLNGADLVITGEGKADATTLSGKAPVGILSRSKILGVPVALLAGKVANRQSLINKGFSEVIQTTPDCPDPGISYASYLKEAATRLIKNQ